MLPLGKYIYIFIFAIASLGSVYGATYSVPVDVQNTYITATSRVSAIKQMLFSQIMAFDYSRLSVLIDGFQREPRGRMKDATVYLSPYVSRDSEFIKLFAHELAHYIDIYVFAPPWNTSDISEEFYRISWKSVTTQKSGQSTGDFVSGYAASNQYEDFAETFVFFIFHNATFADRAMTNETLRQKYLFFAGSVFPKGYFQGSDFSIGKVPTYSWDTTKIPFSLQKYLYSL